MDNLSMRMGWDDEATSINNLSSHTNWSWTKRIGWDNQKTGLQSINKFTYKLEMDKEDGMR